MKTPRMQDLTTLSKLELENLFLETNSTFAKNLINGAQLSNEQERIDILNEISRALNLLKQQENFCF